MNSMEMPILVKEEQELELDPISVKTEDQNNSFNNMPHDKKKKVEKVEKKAKKRQKEDKEDEEDDYKSSDNDSDYYDSPKKSKSSKKSSEPRNHTVSTLKKANVRLKKRNDALKNILKMVKDEKDVILNMKTLLETNVLAADLFTCMQKKSKNKNADSEYYTSELKKFSLTLNSLSPIAYRYVRSKFEMCLPHPSVLKTWYANFDRSGGPSGVNDADDDVPLRQMSPTSSISE